MVRGQIISGVIKLPYKENEREIEELTLFINELSLTMNKRINEMLICEFSDISFQGKDAIGVDLKIVKSRQIEVDEIKKMIFSEITKKIGKRVCVLITTRIINS